jgi:hypothetical protein
VKYTILLIPIVFASLCVSQSDIKDCGSNQQCFYDATENCELAKLSIEHLRPTGNETEQIALNAAIQGTENDKCVIFVEYTNVPNVGEVNMTCKAPEISDGKYVRVLEDPNNIYSLCSGSLISYYTQ